ncbi:hypothetical protein AGABI2DRAFT_218475 [Agaricus bisporus var. bisporus H97]|uniref:hypothetical protein n=1 Tax=Agaricus bisporus var. bisporus (strain H97 / ATCC MYA-4626 / FGSC 10389) TaxID=936046 RepID=UPI00029F7642|nr:hypothetical protein AGABI2DRAFT_218475 [Agaricus bisporus var. bisporus H97]EKV49273.1 hypothetical protein AGABI2DRAFT_218475 [Agaricus bisporus var. bisporus H97]
MFYELEFQALFLFNFLGWINLLLLASGVSAKSDGTSIALRPRFLPREQLTTLPLVIRRSPAEPTKVVVNATSTTNATQPNITQANAGWSAVTQGADKQSYYVLMKIGGINFRLVLDTASSDLWVVSSGCETETCKSLPKYPLDYSSPTFQSVNENLTAFGESFGDGTYANGFVAMEEIEMGGLTVSGQAMGFVTNSSVVLADQESGIVGMGFQRLSTVSNKVANSTTLLSRLVQQGLPYPMFGLSLNRQGGSLSLGAIDASIVTSPHNLSWNSVTEFSPFGAESNASSYLHWAIPLSSFSVNGTQLTPIPSQAAATRNVSLALLDVGTFGMYGPFQDVVRLYDMIDGARLVDADSGQWIVPCTTSILLSFTFGSREYFLRPEDYIIGPASGNPNLCLSWPRGLPPSSDGIDWQMGSAFLQTVYSVFSYGIDRREPPKIGLYPLNDNQTNITSGSTQMSSTVFAPQTTIDTTLPNFLVPTPTFTTPPYTFNTSVPASLGGIVSSGLASSTYRPILVEASATMGFNASAIPTVSPAPIVVTVTMSDGKTSVTTLSNAKVTLGVPPGSSGAIGVEVPDSLFYAVLMMLCVGIIMQV